MTFAVATSMSGNTQTLVTSAIVQLDATPFRAWYNHHYGVDLSRKKKAAFSKKEGGYGFGAVLSEATGEEEKRKSKHTLRKLAAQAGSTPRGANAEWKATRVHRLTVRTHRRVSKLTRREFSP
ncbi:40S ribosomal protein S8-1 [Selaginella moellendorffii]|uniref:40S ribosomal protein S8-1 n=1 Tax=Selaginella moellendorffii TaxID=88036 RepID=UPI000D1CE835|nr:40S ribosomal protein S8-1 [Selaginella moellendorffii]|eukprot:XP_024537510.1 40S ribosomal protein S8-1 [Selaginella moellendorffii]